jgi:16S rRNA (cytosine1402-N4)-methyltransferase
MTEVKPIHTPVMCSELASYLKLDKGLTILDCTVGSAGHAEAILKQIGPRGRLVGIDQDAQALEAAESRLEGFANRTLVQGNFRNIDGILKQLNLEQVDGVIFDLGVSSLQLDSAARGFSMKQDGPLDMRMDRNSRLSAFDLVNFLPQEGLSDIFRKYGQERWHNRIARAIIRERKKSVILSTGRLADLVRRVVPLKYTRIHPATRIFQALRIAVNDELEALQEALKKCVKHIKPGARVCVISFHSLEDRIVKNQFRQFAKEGKLKLITKKPLRPTQEEVLANPRARSARLRVAERVENNGRGMRHER